MKHTPRLELEQGPSEHEVLLVEPGSSDHTFTSTTKQPRTWWRWACEGAARHVRSWWKPCCTGLAATCLLACVLSLIAESRFYNAPPWPTTGVDESLPWGPSSTSDLAFYVIGDWGKWGNEQQLSVAALMGELAEGAYHPSFVLSVGDNFYEHGLSGPDDPLFSKSFSDVYTAKGLQIPWLVTLGNHDYGSYWHGFLDLLNIRAYAAHYQDTSTAAGKQLAARDPRWNCMQGTWRRSFGGHLDVIFLDTMPLFRSLMWSSKSGALAFTNVKRMLEKFEDLLQSSTATFKLVVGHHPVRSLGSHCAYRETAGDCAYMSALEPILEKHQVDAYLSGHDHSLQLIRQNKEDVNGTSSLLYVSSGAGGHVSDDSWEKIPEELRTSQRVWVSDNPGFVAASLNADSLTFDYWDTSSKQKVMSTRRAARV